MKVRISILFLHIVLFIVTVALLSYNGFYWIYSLSAGTFLLISLYISLWSLERKDGEGKTGTNTLQLIYETMGEGLLVMDADGYITHVNRSATEILGFNRKELIGQQAHYLFHAHAINDNLPLEDCPIYKVVHKGEAFSGKENFRRKDGEYITVRLQSKPLMENQEVTGSVTTFEDLTDELTAQQLIAEHEQMLHTIYDVLPVGISVTDPEGRIIDANAASEVLLGAIKEEHLQKEFIGKEWEIIRSDGTRMPVEEYASVRALNEQRAVRNVVKGIVKPTGITWVSVSAMPAGHPRYGVVVAYVDITERRKAEIALEKINISLSEQVENEVTERLGSQLKFQVLFNSVPDATFVHGFESDGSPGNFIEVNDAACELLGVPRDQCKKIGPASFNPNRSIDETDRLAKILREKGFLEIEDEIVDSSGRIHTTLTAARLLHIGNQALVLTVVHDMTEIRELEREKEAQQAFLIQQSKMAEMGNMVAAIAHQWKQPLNVISVIAQDLPEALELGELDSVTLDNSVEKIMKQVFFMNSTVDDFRNFYKANREKVSFSLKKALEEVLSLLQAQLYHHGIKVFLFDSDEIFISGYENEFKQVILNIVNNARDAFLEHEISNPEIRFNIEPVNDQMILTICDNAGGIPENLLPEKIFEPLTSTKGEKGTGIGMYLVRKILEKMDGSITAFNNAEGACFKIELQSAK